MKEILNILIVFVPFALFGQINEQIRKGNSLYNDGEYEAAENAYNKALSIDNKSYEGAFNLGDSYFRQEKYEEAAGQFESIAENSKDLNTKSWAYHNLGNSLLQNQQLDESIEAYKNALRSNPANEAARYNMAYAQQLKKQQQQQEQQDQQQEDNQDKNEEEKKDEKKENEDNKKDEEEKKNEQDKENQNKKENEDGEENKDEQQEQQPEPNQLSKEDAKRLLEAQKNQEQKTQDKLRELKLQKGKKVKIEKDW